MISLKRRNLLGIVGGAIVAGAFGEHEAQAAVPSFVAFGDSYTFSNYNKVPSWADQTKNSGAGRQIVNLAWPGAKVEGLDLRSTFDGQVDLWLHGYRPRGLPDKTVVYFGNNDVRTSRPLAPIKERYKQQLGRLITAGANWGQRKIVLCLLHDWSRNPASAFNVRSRVLEWNGFVRKLAGDRRNCVVVDLFTVFEDVFAKPAKYGFSNVQKPHYTLSATSYLFADGLHFGKRGQALIAATIRAQWA